MDDNIVKLGKLLDKANARVSEVENRAADEQRRRQEAEDRASKEQRQREDAERRREFERGNWTICCQGLETVSSYIAGLLQHGADINCQNRGSETLFFSFCKFNAIPGSHMVQELPECLLLLAGQLLSAGAAPCTPARVDADERDSTTKTVSVEELAPTALNAMGNAPSAYTKPDMIIITSVRPGPINEDDSVEEARELLRCRLEEFTRSDLQHLADWTGSKLSGKARFKTVREELARIVANACTTPDHQIAASRMCNKCEEDIHKCLMYEYERYEIERWS
ncbi:hypothetical protein SCUP234_05254 [Seiridium cupressi]